jgi:FKBP-type peptidyl-prolyl cis-trans isomerase SlyD
MMKIQPNTVVSLTYELKVKEHDKLVTVEKVENEDPFVFLFGAGGLPDKFEESLEGLETGSAFTCRLSSEESGYGEIDKNAIVELPLNLFMIEGKIDHDALQPGNYIPMADQDGNKLQGLVLKVTEDTVKMDFNHPLAGRELYFSGQIMEVRQATPEEIDHGHVHGPDGHHH